MSMNRVQFQLGLSMPEFLRCYGTQAQCAAAVKQARWPAGFAAHAVMGPPTAGCTDDPQCQAYRHQTSLIAGTVMQGTKLTPVPGFSLKAIEHRARSCLALCSATDWLVSLRLPRRDAYINEL